MVWWCVGNVSVICDTYVLVVCVEICFCDLGVILEPQGEVNAEHCKTDHQSERRGSLHTSTLGAVGFQPNRLAADLPLFDVEMYDQEAGFWPNIANYYTLCMNADFLVTPVDVERNICRHNL